MPNAPTTPNEHPAVAGKAENMALAMINQVGGGFSPGADPAQAAAAFAAIPDAVDKLMAVVNKYDSPPAPVETKKRRRRAGGKIVGWPSGVSRNDYATWKSEQQSKGVTENLNPQELKRQLDAGTWTAPSSNAPPVASKPASAAPKAAAPAAAPKAPAAAPKAATPAAKAPEPVKA